MHGSDAKLVPAAMMAYAVARDPQFTPPVQPRLPTELVRLTVDDGLLFEGGPERQLLRGKAVQSLLPQLLPLLDGTRTLPALLEALPGVPPIAVTNAIALLYSRGLLEEGAPAASPDIEGFPDTMLGFFRRNVDATRMNASAAEAAARLMGARIAVWAEPAVTHLANEALTRNGFRDVVTLTDPSEIQELQPSLVLVTVSAEEPEELLLRLDAACAEAGVPWLRCSARNRSVEIGPYFERGETPCYACFSKHRRAVHVPLELPSHQVVHLALERAVLEVVYLASWIGPLYPHDWTVIDLDRGTQRRVKQPPVPGCLHCCLSPPESVMDIPLAYAYERAVAFPSKRYVSPKDHQLHYRVSNLELAREVKQYPSAVHEAIPLVEGVDDLSADFLALALGGESLPPAPLDRSRLARLLMCTSGLRAAQEVPGKVQRWAPTGGNLGSVESFVVLTSSGAGLSAGCYAYEAGNHMLARVGPTRTDHETQGLIDEITSVLEEKPDFLLILSGALGRVTHKYGPFGYKVVHLDAGVACAQATAIVQCFGWDVRFVQSWTDDQIAELLRLESSVEQPTAIMAVYTRGVHHELSI